MSNLYRGSHKCFLPSFGSFGQAVSEEKNLKNSANQKQELLMAAMFVNESGQNEQSLERTRGAVWVHNTGLTPPLFFY
jgi:hypothetical protein